MPDHAVKAALIGLDTMHAVAFARSLHDPATEKKERVAGADGGAVPPTIDDARLHRDYFEKRARTGKPVHVDKSLIDTLENALAMVRTAERDGN